jgi:pyruvate/2-oxoglutarate dehydrogenase complex dihydrolipoamide dehydrogenase (E3) component
LCQSRNKFMGYDFHTIIIGAGTAGLTAASGLSSLGAKTALIEKNKMGGDCLNFGCVPSKTFLRSAHLVDTIRSASKFGVTASIQKIDIKEIMQRVKNVVASIAPHDSAERFQSLGVEVISGEARLLDRHRVAVNNRALTGKFIVLAAGSRPAVPDIPGLKESGFLTNQTVFDLETLPERIVVLGAGPVGMELSQGFALRAQKSPLLTRFPQRFQKTSPR